MASCDLLTLLWRLCLFNNAITGVNSINDGVGSMSLGGGASSTLDNCVSNAVGRGVVMSVAAGNSDANACNYSPAREASVR